MANSDISGQITDGSGNPVSNAEVYLWRGDLAGSGGVVASTTADSNGNYSFTAHPDGTSNSESWHVAAEDPSGNVQLQSAYGVTASPPTSVNSNFQVAIADTNSPITPDNTLNLTANVTNSGTDADTQTVALDVDNSVGQVDSSLVALKPGTSQSVTLQWAVPSGQTIQDYQATVASVDDTSTQLVTVTPPEQVAWETATDWDNAVSDNYTFHPSDVVQMSLGPDDFDSYSTGSFMPSPWVQGNVGDRNEVSTLRSHSGSNSHYKEVTNKAIKDDWAYVNTFPQRQYNFISAKYNETSDSARGGFAIYNENENPIGAVFSDNPEVKVQHGGGETILLSSPSPSYDTWRQFEIIIDWGSGTFDVNWYDLDGSSSDQSGTGFSFINSSTAIGRVAISDENWIGGAGSANDDQYSDDVTALFTDSDLTTGTKSFSSSVSPDLQNLTYSLNGQSVTLDIIGSPGTGSEEVVSQTLDGSASYTLTWSNSHTDFRVKVNMSSNDGITDPSVSRVELVS